MDNRLTYLDALRGLAILGVVLVHVSQLAGEPVWLARVGGWGARGVQLFFIVSAFTLLTVDRDTPFPKFLTRRFFRIAPMFYLGIGLYLAIYGMGPRYFAPAGIGPRDVALSLAFLHGWTPNSADSVMPGGWSIGCEAMFYVVFPWLAARVTTWRRSMLFLAASLALSAALFVLVPRVIHGPPAQVRSFSYFLFPAQLPAFATGFLVFHLVPVARSLSWGPRAARLALPAVLAVIAILAVINSDLSRLHLLGDLLLGVLVLCVAVSPPRWLVNRVMAYIGVVSFSVYVVHFAFVEWARGWVAASPAAAALALPVILAASIVVATVTYRLIERPMIAVGRALAPGRPAVKPAQPIP